jgi:hypothetical protein
MSLDIDNHFILFIVEKFKKELDTEKLWLQIINHIPNGIILYDYE